VDRVSLHRLRNPSGYAIEFVRDVSAIDALAHEWNDLPQALEHPLLTADWFGAAASTLQLPTESLILRRNGSLVGVAPLARDLRAGVARLQPLGVRALHEPSGLLYRDADALKELCKAVVGRGNPLILQRMPDSDALRRALAQSARPRGLLLDTESPGSPVVNFMRDGDFAKFEAQLSSRRRQDYRRARRGLERTGRVTFDLRTPSLDSVAADLDEAMRIEASSWKSRRGSTLLHTGRLRDFYGEYARRMVRRGQLHIAYLRVDGAGIAMQFIVEHASRYWVTKVGYDEKWKDHSPGVQLMWDVMRHACNSKLAGVELLGKREAWISIWAKDLRRYRTYVFYPFNLRGLGAAAADAAHSLKERLR
jgi:CelD/BcsL family acetyltransferase involved in cellulose biosynthesis